MLASTPLAPLLLALAAQLGAADERPLIPRDLLFADPDKGSFQLAPDGRRFGYTAEEGGRRHLWIAPVAAPGEPVRTSDDASAPVLGWSFAGPERVVIEAGGPEGRSVLVRDLATGASVDLSSDWAGDATLAALSPARPDEAVLAVRAPEGTDLFRVSLDGTAEPVDLFAAGLAPPPGGRAATWWFDRDLELRAARAARDGAFHLYRRRADGSWALHASYDWQEAMIANVVSISSDGRALWIVDATASDKAVLKEVDVETGEEAVRCADPLADVLFAGATVSPGDGSVQAVVSYFPRMRRHLLDDSLALDFAMLSSLEPGDLSFVEQSTDGATWLVRTMNGGPLCYFAWERATRSARYLGTDVGALEGVELAPRHAAFVPARDGLVLPCDVYLPKGADADRDGRPDRPLPTVLYVHGGPWVGFEWNSWFTNRSFQLLADRGYAVIRTDFRGAAGYGRAFLDAGDREWGGAMQTDLLDVRAWALEHGIAAAGRVAIWGWSYGGYATLEALTRTPDAFACGIAMYGLSDLERFVGGLTGANGAATWYRRVGDVRTEEGRALLRAASPLTKVEALACPLLVTHGARDTRAPKQQSDLFVAACAELEKPVTYVVYPEEPHDYRAAESWISFWAIAEAFLAEHLGGRSQPMGDDLAGAALEVVAGAELIPGLTEARR